MNKQLRHKPHVRPSGFWVATAILLVVIGTIITLRTNNDAAPIRERPETEPSPNVSSSPAVNTDHKIKIVIDAGHGGFDPGADGVSGIQEKAYTLSVSEKIYELLQKDPAFEPYMTRSDDTFVELLDRAKMANDLHASALISIHANFFKDPQVHGTETFYYSDESAGIARLIHQNLVHTMGLKDREVRKRNLQVLTASEMPAALLEIGYLTNPNEEAAMITVDGQTRTAQAIVEGIKQYFQQTDPMISHGDTKGE